MKIWYTIPDVSTSKEYHCWAAIRDRVEDYAVHHTVLTAADSPALREWITMAPDNGVVILGVEE